MTDWRFEHSVVAQVPLEAAWAFWTDVSNWDLDPSVEWAKLDGPFAAGTRGITKQKVGEPIQWRIREASLGDATIEIELPGAVVYFRWRFVPAGVGATTITQSVILSGPNAEVFVNIANTQLAAGIPEGMRKLAAATERARG
jgi:Polyketide cyclase / dehydrase and lipid transport